MASNMPLESLVSCSVCFEVYTQPSILPCLHTLCWPCVQLLKTGHRISCPECRVVSPVRTIKKDFNKQQLIEVYQKYEESQSQGKEAAMIVATEKGEIDGAQDKCELCANSNTMARSKCIQCNKNLCGECEEIHKAIPVCENHIVFVLDKGSINGGKTNIEVQNRLGVLCNKEQLLKENVGRLKRHMTELTKLNVKVCSEISNHENILISQVQDHYKGLRQEVEGMVTSEQEQVTNSIKLLEKHLRLIQNAINSRSTDRSVKIASRFEELDNDIDVESLERDLADSKRHPLLKLVIENGRSWNPRWGHRVNAEKLFTTLKREVSRRDISSVSGVTENKAQTPQQDEESDKKHQVLSHKQTVGSLTTSQQLGEINTGSSEQRPMSPDVAGHNRSRSVPSRHNAIPEKREQIVARASNRGSYKVPNQSLKFGQRANKDLPPPPSYAELGAMGYSKPNKQPNEEPLIPTAPELDLPVYNLTSSPRLRSPRPRSHRADVPLSLRPTTATSTVLESPAPSGINLLNLEESFLWHMLPKNEWNTTVPLVSLCDKLFMSSECKELPFTPVKIHWCRGLLWCTGKNPDGLYICNASCDLIKEIKSDMISRCNAIIPLPNICLLAASETGLHLLNTEGEHIFTLAAGAFSDCAFSQDTDDLVALQYRQQKIFIFRQVYSLLQNLTDNVRPDKVFDVPKPNDFSRFFIFQGEGFSIMDTLSIANQHIYVCRNQSMGPVYCLNMNGKIIREYTGKLTPFPRISCIDDLGNMILTDNDKRCIIKVCSSAGQWRLVDLPEGIEAPWGVAVDSVSQNVWVVTKIQDTFKMVHLLTYTVETESRGVLDMMYTYDD